MKQKIYFQDETNITQIKDELMNQALQLKFHEIDIMRPIIILTMCSIVGPFIELFCRGKISIFPLLFIFSIVIGFCIGTAINIYVKNERLRKQIIQKIQNIITLNDCINVIEFMLEKYWSEKKRRTKNNTSSISFQQLVTFGSQIKEFIDLQENILDISKIKTKDNEICFVIQKKYQKQKEIFPYCCTIDDSLPENICTLTLTNFNLTLYYSPLTDKDNK